MGLSMTMDALTRSKPGANQQLTTLPLRTLGLLVVVAVATVICIAYNVGLWRQQADNSAQAVTVVTNMQVKANQAIAAELPRVANPSSVADAQPIQDLTAALIKLRTLDHSATTQQLATALEDFIAAQNNAPAASATPANIANWYQTEVLPSYSRFTSLAAATAAYYRDNASYVGLRAALGSLGTTLLAGLTMGLLIWIFERATRSAQQNAARQRESVLRQSEERFRSLVQNNADITMLLDAGGCITYASPSIEGLLGYSVDNLAGREFLALLHDDERAKVARFLDEVRQKPGKRVSTDFRVQHTNGYWLFLHALGNNMLANASVGGIMLTAHDISERWMLEEQLTHQAFYDGLSKLPNRALFMDRLGQALLRANRSTGQIAVLFIDLNEFKVINDTLGRRVGDQLLSAVAKRIKDNVREADTVARLGSDEFTLLLEEIESREAVVSLAERISQHLQAPFVLEAHRVFVGASIGVAFSDALESTPEDLLRNADLAMYEAKNVRKTNVALYEQSMNNRAWRRLELANEIREALEKNEFRVFYQPIVDLQSGATVEVEALVRWEHPVRGLLAPGEFIPAAEETGLIVQLGKWVLTEAARQVFEWRTTTPLLSELMLSVNLSPRQFQDPELVNDIAAALCATGLAASYLKLEITESVALENASSALETLRQLKRLGLRLAIDDFGTGYSALSYLKQYPIDTLKIDRSFVTGLGIDPGDTGIVHAVIAFARTLHLQVTAEGIENIRQLNELKVLGADRGQGYYFAKPLSAADMLNKLQQAQLALA